MAIFVAIDSSRSGAERAACAPDLDTTFIWYERGAPSERVISGFIGPRGIGAHVDEPFVGTPRTYDAEIDAGSSACRAPRAARALPDRR